MMDIHVFDVEHGGCTAVIAPSQELLLIGCGHNASTGWRPSDWVDANNLEITNLTIENFDEDHVSDLPSLYQHCMIRSLSTNWHITPEWLRKSKAENGMGSGIQTIITMMERFTGPDFATNWGGMSVQRFCHPPSLFNDVNSLSVVTFVRNGSVTMVFPGDTTRQAWQAFLGDAAFCLWLQDTNLFVASHHGRQDGYCPDVFGICKPVMIIVSDSSIQYDTQHVDYTQHATGLRWHAGSTRYVLTTRNDGAISIQEQGGTFQVTTAR